MIEVSSHNEHCVGSSSPTQALVQRWSLQLGRVRLTTSLHTCGVGQGSLALSDHWTMFNNDKAGLCERFDDICKAMQSQQTLAHASVSPIHILSQSPSPFAVSTKYEGNAPCHPDVTQCNSAKGKNCTWCSVLAMVSCHFSVYIYIYSRTLEN